MHMYTYLIYSAGVPLARGALPLAELVVQVSVMSAWWYANHSVKFQWGSNEVPMRSRWGHDDVTMRSRWRLVANRGLVVGKKRDFNRWLKWIKPYFLLGFLGNQPRWTRFSCWKSSRIDQKLEKAITPRITDRYILLANNEPMSIPIPTKANIHQHLVPK